MNYVLKLRAFSVVCIFLLAGSLLIPCSIKAQSTGNLQSESSAILDRLATLRTLPGGGWKFHAGDLAHGESVALDDSSWQTIADGTITSKDALWFRQTYTVPKTLHGYDLTGARIWFQFNAAANGPMPQILYFNGRRVALGDDLEPVVLFDNARSGDSVTVAVKLLHTVDTKRFQHATLRIDFPESRPNPEDLRMEFLSAVLLVPALAPQDSSKMTTLESAIRTVDISALDAADQARFDASLKAARTKLEALAPLLNTASFHLTGNAHIDAAWLWPWTEAVDVVKRTYGTALQLMYEYPDYTFTQSAAAYNEWLADKYPDMNAEIAGRIKEGRWEVLGGMWVEPDLNMPDGESLVRQLLVGKRWYKQAYGVDVRIGWNPDSFGYTWQLPQIYKKSGIDYFVTQKMAWSDTNKLPFKLFWWESPDGSKVLTYFPNDYVNLTLNPERLSKELARSQKLSPGLTNMMDLYGIGDHGGGPTRAMLDEGFHWAEKANRITPKYEFGTAQSYFTSVEKQIAPDSQTWDYASIARGYTPPTPVAGKIAIPTWKSEMYLETHRGVMTTQANHKRNMRESEEELLNAEKWAALAWLDGQQYPGTELTEDWKKVLFNQFHDSAAGSGIAQIYKDAQKDYDLVRMSTDEITRASLQTIADNIDTQGEGIPIVVFNPIGFGRTGTVKIRAQVPYQEGYHLRLVQPHTSGYEYVLSHVSWDRRTGNAEMEANVGSVGLGYQIYRLVLEKDNVGHFGIPLATDASDTGNTLHLRNSWIDVTIDKSTGCITSLLNRYMRGPGAFGNISKWKEDTETIAPGSCANQLQAFKDTPKKFDAWNIDADALDQPLAMPAKADSVELLGAITNTPAIRVTRTWQSSKFVQTITLGSESQLVDIDNEIDWHETHVLLKAAFPVAVTSDHATYEIPYGTIERPTTRNNSWEKAQFEVPALRWADISGTTGTSEQVAGLSVINESKYGYDAVGNLLRLTLLRSPVWPDPDADRGHHHFHYALYPHLGTWKEANTVQRGWEYNYPMTAIATTSHPASATHLGGGVSVYRMDPSDTVIVTAVKKSEDGDALIIRLYEWAGNNSKLLLNVPSGMKGARIANMMEEPVGDWLPIDNYKELGFMHSTTLLPVPIHPYEILTLRVEYPSAGKQ